MPLRLFGTTHQRHVGGLSGQLRQRHRRVVGAEQTRPAQKSGEQDFAGAAPNVITPLDLTNPLELVKPGIQFDAGLDA